MQAPDEPGHDEIPGFDQGGRDEGEGGGEEPSEEEAGAGAGLCCCRVGREIEWGIGFRSCTMGEWLC